MTDQDRERAVSLFTQGFTYQFIADEYGFIRQLSLVCALNSLRTAPLLGDLVEVRRAKEDMLMVRQLKQDNTTCSHKIKQDLGLDRISSRTVRRRLAESGEFENGWSL